MKSPCMSCGELTTTTRCEPCQSRHRKGVIRLAVDYKPPASARGYDWQWTKLSRRARKLQPFCSQCGSKDDLQADHTPEAWRRKERGLAIRLQDIDVLCGPCNRRAGAARGPNADR